MTVPVIRAKVVNIAAHLFFFKGNYMNEPQKLLQYIEQSVRDQLAPFVGEKFNNQNKSQMIDIIKKSMSQIPFVDIDVTVDKDTIIFCPKNIYTALMLDGVKVDYEEVKDKTEYKTGLKTYFLKEDGTIHFKNNFIRFNFKLDV